MHLMLDTDSETLPNLHAISALILAVIVARTKELPEADAGSGKIVAAPDDRRVVGRLPELFAGYHTADDAAKAFGGGAGNVLPFPQTRTDVAPDVTAEAAKAARLPPATSTGGAAPATDTTAASPPAGAAVAPIAASECDSGGLPWDARVHSETRKKNADGTWRFRRHLDDTVKAQVLGELKGAANAPGSIASSMPPSAIDALNAPPGASAAPPPPAPTATPDVPTGTLPLPPAGTVPLPPKSTLPLPPGPAIRVPDANQPPVVPPVNPPGAAADTPPPPPMPPPAAAGSPGMTVSELFPKITKAVHEQKLTIPKVNEACASLGMKHGVTDLSRFPEKIPELAKLLGL